MRWSKLKTLLENRFALNKRVAIYSTRYGNSQCGHAWLTLDGVVIANFCTFAYFNRYGGFDPTDRGIPARAINQPHYALVSYGELSRDDIHLIFGLETRTLRKARVSGGKPASI